MSSKVFSLINEEQQRQEQTINLIASENYASSDILRANGSVLTNKYAEGYPGKRYYGGCEVVDKIETHAQETARKLFSCAHVNVQPHSGSQANMAVYLSALKPQDTVLGMSLNAGGHLTHGHKINFSGALYNFVPYTVSPENEQLDYDEIAILANQHNPKMIIAGASAYSRTIDFARIAEIAQDNGALFMADMAHIAGLVAAGLHPSPIPVADFVTSTTHKTLRGPRGGMICSKAEFAQSIDRAVFPGVQGGPLMNVIAAKAIAFEEAFSPAFKEYQKQVIANAQAMAQTFKDLGYHIVAGGTDNHLFLINLKQSRDPRVQSMNGKKVETLLAQCNIVLNRNGVPFDTESPLLGGGVRIGTPAVTTRGFHVHDCRQIAQWIHEAIIHHDDALRLARIKEAVTTLCAQYPIYQA